ncbi:MAG TPA: hypothetical protein DHW10_06805 [Rhodospirillaceae bacterium]|nr:hypothetical protein [Rhodospirillaceae bacterium]
MFVAQKSKEKMMPTPINPETNQMSDTKLHKEFEKAKDQGHTHLLIYKLVHISAPLVIIGYGYHGLTTVSPQVSISQKAVSFDANDKDTMTNTLALTTETLCRAETGDINPCYKAPEKVFYGVYDLSKPFDDARIKYEELPNQAIETINDLMYKEREQKKGPFSKLLEKVFG